MEAGTRGGEVNNNRAGPVCKLQETRMQRHTHTHREHIHIFVMRLTGMKRKKRIPRWVSTSLNFNIKGGFGGFPCCSTLKSNFNITTEPFPRFSMVNIFFLNGRHVLKSLKTTTNIRRENHIQHQQFPNFFSNIPQDFLFVVEFFI